MWMIGHLFSLRGVRPDRPVVVYDTDSGVRAARAFWFLEYLGHPERARARRRVRRVDTRRACRSRRDASRPARSRGTGARAGRSATLAARARPARRSGHGHRRHAERGRVSRRARCARKRGGAIPGAVHIEWTQNLTADGTFKPVGRTGGDVRGRGRDARPGGRHVLPGRLPRGAHVPGACGWLGFPHVRNYTGSWKEWGDRDEAPVERPGRGGPSPGRLTTPESTT